MTRVNPRWTDLAIMSVACLGALVTVIGATAANQLVAVVIACSAAAVVGVAAIRFRLSAVLLGLFGTGAVLLISRSTLMPGGNSDAALYVALPVLFCIMAARWSSVRFRTAGPAIVIACCTVASSILFDSSSELSAMYVAITWIATVLVGAALTRREVDLVLAFVVLGGVVESVIAVCENLGVAAVRDYLAAPIDTQYLPRVNSILGSHFVRAEGTLGYPIPFAHFIAISIAALFLLRHRLSAFLLAPMLAILVIGELLSGTRTVLFVVPIVIGVGYIWSKGTAAAGRLSVPRIVFFGSAVIASAWVLVPPVVAKMRATDDFSLGHRLQVLESAPRLLDLSLIRVLLGNGWGSHESLFQRGILSTTGTEAVDNGYVMTLAISGVLGLAGLVWALVRFLDARSANLWPIFVVFVVFFGVYDALQWHAIAFLFWLLVGCASGPLARHWQKEPVDG